jgi:hypothetical protein
MTKDEALQMCLEYIETDKHERKYVRHAIKSALELQAEQIGWAVQGCSKMWRGDFAEIDAKAEAKRIGGTCVAFALYTEPPQRSWVGLTPEEVLDLFDVNNVYGSKWIEFARTVKTKLNKKNT